MINDIKYRLFEIRNFSLKDSILHHKSLGIFKDCMKFCEAYKENHSDVENVTDDWYSIFVKVCKYLGINKSGSDVLWNDMCCGNWKHLWATEDERDKSADDWFVDFSADVFYCSDRWSIDRLMRCHWMYRQWIKAKNKS
jgi:hypothetical protein